MCCKMSLPSWMSLWYSQASVWIWNCHDAYDIDELVMNQLVLAAILIATSIRYLKVAFDILFKFSWRIHKRLSTKRTVCANVGKKDQGELIVVPDGLRARGFWRSGCVMKFGQLQSVSHLQPILSRRQYKFVILEISRSGKLQRTY